MEAHEYANLFPMMSDDKLQELANDIRDHGQKDDILTFENKILDGRNRFKACGLVGVTPRMVAWYGEDPLSEVISRNLIRRNLTESQYGMIAQEAARMRSGNPAFGPITARAVIRNDEQRTIKEAAETFGISEDTVGRARKVAEHGVPELADSVRSGAVAVKTAALVAKLPPEVQEEVVKGGAKGIKAAARDVREYGVETASQTLAAPTAEYSAPEEGQSKRRLPKVVTDDADRLWFLGKLDLDKILPTDISRERVLKEVIEYAQNRIIKYI